MEVAEIWLYQSIVLKLKECLGAQTKRLKYKLYHVAGKVVERPRLFRLFMVSLVSEMPATCACMYV